MVPSIYVGGQSYLKKYVGSPIHLNEVSCVWAPDGVASLPRV